MNYFFLFVVKDSDSINSFLLQSSKNYSFLKRAVIHLKEIYFFPSKSWNVFYSLKNCETFKLWIFIWAANLQWAVNLHLRRKYPHPTTLQKKQDSLLMWKTSENGKKTWLFFLLKIFPSLLITKWWNTATFPEKLMIF